MVVQKRKYRQGTYLSFCYIFCISKMISFRLKEEKRFLHAHWSLQPTHFLKDNKQVRAIFPLRSGTIFYHNGNGVFWYLWRSFQNVPKCCRILMKLNRSFIINNFSILNMFVHDLVTFFFLF